VGNTTISQGSIDLSEASERIPNLSNISISSGDELRFFSGVANETVGSLEGAGRVVLGNTDAGGTNLTVGASNTHTTYSGNIREDFGGTGKLTKVGAGTLTLSGANTYSEGTVISEGALQVNSNSLPATGGVTNNSMLIFDQTFAGPTQA